MYVNHIPMLYALNVYSARFQLYLNKTENKKEKKENHCTRWHLCFSESKVKWPVEIEGKGGYFDLQPSHQANSE